GSSTFANITGATAASYTTSATTTADDGREFRCVVTNSVGSVTSGVSTLSVNAAPVITTQPVSQPVPRGEFARFRVVASGTPAPSYQWQWAPKGSSAFSDITQGTSNTWGTARVNDAIDGRQYRCVVTNSAGSATSDIVTLTMIREAQPTVGFVTATQSLLEGPEPVPNPPILNYPYESYPKAPELALQPVGWPLTEEERTYVLKSEGLRFPGVESNKHLPQLWPVTPMAACWGQTGDTRWLDHHTTLVNTVQANKGAIDILLVGDSLTEYWGGGFSGAPFNAAWKSHFAQYRTVNIGIGGDKTQNILWRLKHGAIDGAAPKVVVLLIGTNNISSTVYNGTPIEAVAQGIKLCVDGLRAKCPNSEIVVVRPFPMGPVGTATFVNGQKINTAVEGLKFENDPKVHILDFYREFFNADGSIKTEYFDSPQSILHLDYVKGYNLYADKLKPMVEQLMAKIAAAEATPKTTPVKVTVKLSAASTQAVTIPFSVGGTAIKSVDYTISASPLTIPAGATSAEIMVMVNDDVAAEIGKETIVITLEATNGATLGTEGVHTIVINDHDLPTPLKAN
ncbi:MAG: GDSL-type esterase/lipase family protein, partial [Verrucomicrobiota bacterium]